MPTLERLDLADARSAALWDAFVLACPQASVFHRTAWGRAIASTFGHATHYLYTHEAGQITGVLPLGEIKSLLFGHAITSLPFAVYGGVAANDAASAAMLERAAIELGRQRGAQHLELRHLERRHADWPLQDLYVTFRKPILADEEANMLAIPRKQRAMVRKGIKNDLTASFDPGVDRFFSLYAGNVHRHGTPALPKSWFEALRREYGSDCEVLTVTGPSGQLLSSVLGFRFRGEVLPYYAGDDEAARDLAANDFKYWELMRHACARGDTLFDYGRSKLGTGPYAFKKNWGFEPQPLAYEFQLFKRDAVPQNNPSNAKYKLLIETWRKLPLTVANWLGPMVVRSLG
ncbi:MAG: FemAB family XrtA/PEP-CTERM system-associated protein [Rubrivivax sp.]|jgi:FemAB-related protein (PEP-CTERM system-associated)|nr:FemAB family PEP-CTERM system-associated protein [Rubrivivax sp.]